MNYYEYKKRTARGRKTDSEVIVRQRGLYKLQKTILCKRPKRASLHFYLISYIKFYLLCKCPNGLPRISTLLRREDRAICRTV